MSNPKTIKEASMMKSKLEEVLCEKIKEFEDSTSLSVTRVELSTLATGLSQSFIDSVSITTELN